MERMVRDIVKPDLDKKIGDAPADDKQYARKNKNWEEVQGGSGPGLTKAVFDVTPFEDVKAAWDRGDIVYVDYTSGEVTGRGYLAACTYGDVGGKHVTSLQFDLIGGINHIVTLTNGFGDENDGWAVQ